MELYEKAMKMAIDLAKQGRFFVAPNPCVGAVLIKDNEIVASGYHHNYGNDHAEVDCLKNARKNGIDTKNATIVVTLEPCNHTGKTPPCTKAIIEAGITKVVVGLRDPHDIASGGIEFLQNHNIEVISGVCEEECKISLADYLVWIQEKRPYIILKMATSLDGKISLEENKPYPITNAGARTAVANLRAKIGLANGLVLVGNNTFIYDNPKLNARDIECLKQPRAGVLCSNLPELDNKYYLLEERIKELIFLTNDKEAKSSKALALQAKGAKVYAIDSIKSILPTLYKEEKINYIFCEGGAKLATSLLTSNLVDEYRQFIAPKMLLSNSAIPVVNPNLLENKILDFKLLEFILHEDTIEGIYLPKKSNKI